MSRACPRRGSSWCPFLRYFARVWSSVASSAFSQSSVCISPAGKGQRFTSGLAQRHPGLARCCQQPFLASPLPRPDGQTHTAQGTSGTFASLPCALFVETYAKQLTRKLKIKKKIKLLSGRCCLSIEYFFSLGFHYRNLNRQKTCELTSCRCPVL